MRLHPPLKEMPQHLWACFKATRGSQHFAYSSAQSIFKKINAKRPLRWWQKQIAKYTLLLFTPISKDKTDSRVLALVRPWLSPSPALNSRVLAEQRSSPMPTCWVPKETILPWLPESLLAWLVCSLREMLAKEGQMTPSRLREGWWPDTAAAEVVTSFFWQLHWTWKLSFPTVLSQKAFKTPWLFKVILRLIRKSTSCIPTWQKVSFLKIILSQTVWLFHIGSH